MKLYVVTFPKNSSTVPLSSVEEKLTIGICFSHALYWSIFNFAYFYAQLKFRYYRFIYELSHTHIYQNIGFLASACHSYETKIIYKWNFSWNTALMTLIIMTSNYCYNVISAIDYIPELILALKQEWRRNESVLITCFIGADSWALNPIVYF